MDRKRGNIQGGIWGLGLVLLLVLLGGGIRAEAAERMESKLTGVNTTFTKKSRSTIKDKVKVSPANGRLVKLQYYHPEKKKWVTKKTFTTEKKEKSEISIDYPNDWWVLPKSKWRILVPKSEEAKTVISKTITISTKRYYQNPSGYYQVKDSIKLTGGNYKLSYGYMGLKVRKVNSYFGIGDWNWPRYTNTTKEYVSNFQRRNGLSVTGVVNQSTWLAMGFSKSDWSNLGAYVSPIKTNLSSTRKDHIEAMIARAYEYLGSSYVVGASGTPSDGVDCSGLIMQCMYASGIDSKPITSVRHSKAGYEYESRNLFTSKKLKTVSYSKRQRGDLIFYGNSSGVVIHVALYLGNNQVIESWPNKVVVWPIQNSHRSNIVGVRRVFN